MCLTRTCWEKLDKCLRETLEIVPLKSCVNMDTCSEVDKLKCSFQVSPFHSLAANLLNTLAPVVSGADKLIGNKSISNAHRRNLTGSVVGFCFLIPTQISVSQEDTWSFHRIYITASHRIQYNHTLPIKVFFKAPLSKNPTCSIRHLFLLRSLELMTPFLIWAPPRFPLAMRVSA